MRPASKLSGLPGSVWPAGMKARLTCPSTTWIVSSPVGSYGASSRPDRQRQPLQRHRHRAGRHSAPVGRDRTAQRFSAITAGGRSGTGVPVASCERMASPTTETASVPPLRISPGAA